MLIWYFNPLFNCLLSWLTLLLYFTVFWFILILPNIQNLPLHGPSVAFNPFCSTMYYFTIIVEIWAVSRLPVGYFPFIVNVFLKIDPQPPVPGYLCTAAPPETHATAGSPENPDFPVNFWVYLIHLFWLGDRAIGEWVYFLHLKSYEWLFYLHLILIVALTLIDPLFWVYLLHPILSVLITLIARLYFGIIYARSCENVPKWPIFWVKLVKMG